METFKCGTLGNLAEPGARFSATAPNHPEALFARPQAFQAVGGKASNTFHKEPLCGTFNVLRVEPFCGTLKVLGVEPFCGTLKVLRVDPFCGTLKVLRVDPFCGTLKILRLEPFCGTFKVKTGTFLWNLQSFKTGTFLWNLDSSKSGTLMWNLAEPGARFSTTPKLYLQDPKLFKLLGKNNELGVRELLPSKLTYTLSNTPIFGWPGAS